MVEENQPFRIQWNYLYRIPVKSAWLLAGQIWAVFSKHVLIWRTNMFPQRPLSCLKNFTVEIPSLVVYCNRLSVFLSPPNNRIPLFTHWQPERGSPWNTPAPLMAPYCLWNYVKSPYSIPPSCLPARAIPHPLNMPLAFPCLCHYPARMLPPPGMPPTFSLLSCIPFPTALPLLLQIQTTLQGPTSIAHCPLWNFPGCPQNYIPSSSFCPKRPSYVREWLLLYCPTLGSVFLNHEAHRSLRTWMTSCSSLLPWQ